MIHDQSLVDRLSGLATERFDGTVYRATRVNADPTAPSINGGRWAPPPSDEPGIFVLYTSFERDGAIAEMVSFLADLTPMPGPRPIKVATLAVTTSKTLRLARADLDDFGGRSCAVWGTGLLAHTENRWRPYVSWIGWTDCAVGAMGVRQPDDLRRQPQTK